VAKAYAAQGDRVSELASQQVSGMVG